jgi:sorting nexin-1/2
MSAVPQPSDAFGGAADAASMTQQQIPQQIPQEQQASPLAGQQPMPPQQPPSVPQQPIMMPPQQMPQQQQQQQHMPQQQNVYQPMQPPAFPPPPVPIVPAGGGGRPEDAAMHITVSDPVQHQDGMSKFTSYRVDVRPPEAAGGSLDSSIFQNAAYSAVLRRYSDFLWLYERLHRERAGAIVPPVPDKQAVSRFTPAFVEQRRRDLEVFLRRVAVHPELRDAACLDTFLRADEATFRHAKALKEGGAPMAMDMAASGYGMPPPPMSPPPAGGGGQAPVSTEKKIKSWFSETKTSIAGDLVRSPDDDLFDEIERYIAGLDAQMRAVSSQASGLVRKGKELANGMFEFGLAFTLLGRSEQEVLGAALTKVGEAADAVSALDARNAEQEARDFEAPLVDYVRTIHAVRLALHRRHERRLAYTARLSELNAKQANVMRLRSTPGQEAKAYAAEMSLQRGQAAADAARDDFMAVSQRVLREVDRFKREKAEDMKRTVYQYIEMQIEYNRKMEKIWADLIPVLENVPLRDDQVAAAGVDVPEPKQVTLPNADIPGGAAAVATEQAQDQIQQQMENLQVQQQQEPATALPPAAAPPVPPPGSDGITDVPLTDPMMGSGIQYRP